MKEAKETIIKTGNINGENISEVWMEMAQLYPDGSLVKIITTDGRDSYAVIRHPDIPGSPLRIQPVENRGGTWVLAKGVVDIPKSAPDLIMTNLLSLITDNIPTIIGYNQPSDERAAV